MSPAVDTYKQNEQYCPLSLGTTTSNISSYFTLPSFQSPTILDYDPKYSWRGSDCIDETKPQRFILARGGCIPIQPIVLADFCVESKTFHFKTPLEIEPEYDYECDAFVLRNDSLGIDVYSESFSELREDLLSELAFLWEAYAQGDATIMTSRALQLKNNLLSSIH